MVELSSIRNRVIAGKTWLVVQLMQGSTFVCHHHPRRHFAEIGGKTVTEEHSSEAGLCEELYKHHDLTFRMLSCQSSVENIDYLRVEWKWKIQSK